MITVVPRVLKVRIAERTELFEFEADANEPLGKMVDADGEQWRCLVAELSSATLNSLEIEVMTYDVYILAGRVPANVTPAGAAAQSGPGGLLATGRFAGGAAFALNGAALGGNGAAQAGGGVHSAAIVPPVTGFRRPGTGMKDPPGPKQPLHGAAAAQVQAAADGSYAAARPQQNVNPGIAARDARKMQNGGGVQQPRSAAGVAPANGTETGSIVVKAVSPNPAAYLPRNEKSYKGFHIFEFGSGVMLEVDKGACAAR